jgi:hypothetical protein
MCIHRRSSSGTFQRQVVEAGVVQRLHKLEEMWSSRHTGTQAEKLLEALANGNESVATVLKQLQEDSSARKRALAAAQREKILAEMGLLAGTNLLTATAQNMGWCDDDLEDESGYVCAICHEVCVFVCMYVCICVYVCIYVCIYIHIHIHICVCVCVYIYIYIYIYIHIQIHIWPRMMVRCK